MDQTCIRRVGDDRAVECAREFRGLHPLRNAAHPRDIDLHDLDSLFQQVVSKRLSRINMLAQCDRDVQFSGQNAMGANVLRRQGFFKPVNSKLLQALPPNHGRVQVPRLVHVEHQIDIISDRLAHLADAVVILARIGFPHLHLDGRPPLIQDPLHVVEDFIHRLIEPAAVRVVSLNLFLFCSTQNSPQRLSSGLGDEVPQGDIHRGDRHGGDALSADPVNFGPIELVPDLLDVRGVLPNEDGHVITVDGRSNEVIT